MRNAKVAPVTNQASKVDSRHSFPSHPTFFCAMETRVTRTTSISSMAPVPDFTLDRLLMVLFAVE